MRAISAAILLVMASQVATEEALRLVIDFSGPEAARRWQAVNAGVMGGVSDGRFMATEARTLEFFGTLSLENNGGFASVRTKPTELDLKAGDTIVVRVKGDGREYVLNLYTKNRRMPFSYRTPLPTARGEWTEVRVPLADFIPTAFGRRHVFAAANSLATTSGTPTVAGFATTSNSGPVARFGKCPAPSRRIQQPQPSRAGRANHATTRSDRTSVTIG